MEKTSSSKPSSQPRRRTLLLIAGPLVLIVIGAALYLFGGRRVSTDNAYVKTDKTSICTEVTGRIVDVSVEDNGRVTKGQELFRIDPEPYEIAVHRAEAALNSIRTEVESLRFSYRQKLAELSRAEENVRYCRTETERYSRLVEKAAVSREKNEQMQHNLTTAIEECEAIRQSAAALKAQLSDQPDLPIDEFPRVKQAKAELAKAQYDLSRAHVTAPTGGITANVDMQPGEYALAGLPLFTIVDDTTTWVEANFKETDLTHVQTGQEAKIEVDTYPGVKWKARVISITPATGAEFSILPAENSSGNWVKVVQRIMVKLELEPTDSKPTLAAGMSTVVTIDTGACRLTRFFGKDRPDHG